MCIRDRNKEIFETPSESAENQSLNDVSENLATEDYSDKINILEGDVIEEEVMFTNEINDIDLSLIHI